MREVFSNFRWWEDDSIRSMAIEDGKVLIAPTTESIPGGIDLQGQYLLPKFIDAHCHILPTGLDLLKLDLSGFQTKEEIFDALRDWSSQKPEGWILAVQYNQTRFADSKHISKQELDAISPERPILLRHSNGHASIANSRALELAGVHAGTKDPEGGEYGRDESGDFNGLLLETAHEFVTSKTPQPDLEEMIQAILLAGDRMSDLGIGMACDMMTGRFDIDLELRAYEEAAKRGNKIRTRLYVQWRDVFGPRAMGLEAFREREASFSNPDRARIAGIKIFGDGAIGSATAAIYGSYQGQPDAKTSGQLIYSPEKLTKMTVEASAAGYQVAIHSIGDYASDLVMDAFEATGEASRHRIEHAMMLSNTQIDRLTQLNPYVTFQPEFIMRFGQTYMKQLGAERASTLKRARTLIDRGLRLSFNSDRPIVPGDPRDGIRTAVSRPDGFDPEENVTLKEAFRAYTREAADVSGDSGKLGCLNEGELADYRVSKSLLD